MGLERVLKHMSSHLHKTAEFSKFPEEEPLNVGPDKLSEEKEEGGLTILWCDFLESGGIGIEDLFDLFIGNCLSCN